MGTAARARRIALQALGLVGVTYVLIVLGAAVRANDAGLACPDWPLCFGQVVPALDVKVAFEFGHRVLAGLVSLGFVAIAVQALRDRVLRSRVGALLGVAAVVLATQIVLGGLTVLELLAEWTVTSHLLTGNAFAVVLLLIALRLRELGSPVDRAPVGSAERAVAALVAIVVIAQLALGGLVASSHAGLACGTWPGCNGPAWFPTWSGLIGLQVMHRAVAYTLLGVVLLALAATRGRGRTGRGALVLVGLVILQVVIGVANVLLHLPVEVTVLHSAGAAAIVLATAWLNRETWKAPLRRTETLPHALPEAS